MIFTLQGLCGIITVRATLYMLCRSGERRARSRKSLCSQLGQPQQPQDKGLLRVKPVLRLIEHLHVSTHLFVLPRARSGHAHATVVRQASEQAQYSSSHTDARDGRPTTGCTNDRTHHTLRSIDNLGRHFHLAQSRQAVHEERVRCARTHTMFAHGHARTRAAHGHAHSHTLTSTQNSWVQAHTHKRARARFAFRMIEGVTRNGRSRSSRCAINLSSTP